MYKKKLVLSFMILATIFLLNILFLSPYNEKNISLRKEIESIESRQDYESDQSLIDSDNSNIQSSSQDNEYSDKSYQSDNAEYLKDSTSKNSKKTHLERNREFYEQISMDPNVVSIEKSSQENENKYRIMLRGENKDFIMFMNYLDKQNKKVKIDQIMYNKYEKTGEYTILVNLFSK
ncbi:MAG: hypothetical protein RR561_06895 [Peptostreptococcus sp.]|uniref:hypothetical protein n=1 Tax=Peptostreptococcus sp. TaxID=1262 RepID=UPI002FC5C876